MIKNLKILILITLILLIPILSLACRSKSSKPKIRIAVIPKGTTHDFWKAVHDGAQAAADETGVEIFWNGPSREGDREAQIQIVEDFITRQVAGILLAPLDNKALVPSVENITNSGIPCVIFDSAVDTDDYISFIATDNYKGGQLAAQRMAKILNGKGKIAVIKYQPGSASSTKRENGFIETIEKDFPEIQIVATKFGQDTVETALQAAEDILMKNSQIDGIFACNESTSVGTLRALESQQLVGKIKMVGFDTSRPLVNALKANSIDSLVAQNPYKMGYEGIKTIVSHLNNVQVPKNIDTGVMLITKENVDTPEAQSLIF